jgi:hypothetical protein
MDQPSPTQSDGTLRDMVDSDTQVDQGGNPLGEGTIMMADGERNQFKRDNYMHSSTDSRPNTFNMEPYDALWHEKTADNTNIWNQQTQGPGGTYTPQVRQDANQGMSPGQWAELGGAVALGVGTAGIGDAALGAGAAGAAAAEGAASTGAAAETADVAEAGASGAAKGGLSGALGTGAGQVAKKGLEGLGEGAAKGLAGLMRGSLGQGAAPAAASPTPGWIQGASFKGSSKDIPMLLVADFETSDSIPRLDTQDDGPHGHDQKEFSDGDLSPSNFHNPNLQDSGANGEDGTRSDSSERQGFASDSPGIERAHMIMPLLMHYYNSGESGEHDPLVSALHETLERENPGYLSNVDQDATNQLLEHYRNPSPIGVHAAANGLPGGEPTTGTLPGQPPVNSIPQPQAQGGVCPNCGGALGPDGSCPQCGNGNNGTTVPPVPMGQQPLASIALEGIAAHLANHQGPVTPEQIAAVQEILLQQGRADECPNVPLHPEQYAKEMAEIQNTPNVAPQIDPSQDAQTPPPAMPQAPGGMPVTDPSQPGGGGMPMQPMSSQHTSWDYFDNGGGGRGPARAEFDVPDRGYYDREDGLKGENELNLPTENSAIYRGDGPRLQPPAQWTQDDYATGRPIRDNLTDPHAVTMVDPTKAAPVRTFQPVDPWMDNEPGTLTVPPHWGSAEIKRAQEYGETKKSDANTNTPRCPNCGSGSTTIDAPGDPTGAEGDKALCHACHTLFDPADPKKSSVNKVADANTMTPRCPGCGSGSTRVDDLGGDPTNADGSKGYCPSCGLVFDPADPKVSRVSTLVFADEVEVPNPALQKRPDSPIWRDVHGKDLMPGHTYELHSAAFSVPTEIKVMNVKPDGLEAQLVGGVGNATGQPDLKIDRREAQMEKYEFVPVQLGTGNVEPDNTPGQSPEQVPPLDTTDNTPDVNPHTEITSGVQNNDICTKCGSLAVDSRMLSPEVTHYACVACTHEWESRDEDPGVLASVDLSWINESGDLGFSPRYEDMVKSTGNQTRNLADIASKDKRLQEIKARLDAQKVAGKHFSPSEKKDLINEHGKARNLEDLDLTNTHYEARVDYTGKANGELVDDDHFVLGL